MAYIKIEITEEFREIKYKGTKQELLKIAMGVLIRENKLLKILKELIKITELFKKSSHYKKWQKEHQNT